MDDFGGWSMPYAAESCLPSRPSDDGLLSEFLGGGFDLRSDHGGLDLPSSYPVQNLVQCHDAAAGLSAGVPAGFMGLDTADVLPSVVGAGAAEDGLLDPFVYAPNVVGAGAEEPAQAAASNTAFSGYSSTTGGNGNFSSGESNSCGGGGYDTEVASPPCAVSRPGLLQTTTGGVPPSKRKPGNKYATAMSAPGTAAAAAAAAAGRRGEKQAAATSSSSTSIAFKGPADGCGYEPDSEAIAQVKEMIYRAAAMRPVHQLVCGAGEPPLASLNQARPRRKNVRISSDPQTVAARLRRERVSERLRVLQRLVPGGSRMDTASMLDEAASYLKFLKSQLKALERASPSNGGYHSSSLLQSYAGSSVGVGGGSGGASTVLAFGRDSAMGGYVKSNRDMQL